MRPLRKMILTVVLGMTAMSTLIAGMPHSVCRCPNGQIKLFCLSSLFSGQCCNGSCCSRETVRGNCSQVGERSSELPQTSLTCCHCRHQPAAGTTGQGIQPSSGGCQKTMVAGQSVCERPTKSIANENMTSGKILFISHISTAFTSQATMHHALARYRCGSPPPTDLIVLHQHFVI